MSKFTELTEKLREIFQIDRPELDFGVYRILNARAGEINEYLDKRLEERVKLALASGSAANLDHVRQELAETEKNAKAAGFNPDDAPKVKELRAKIAELEGGAVEYENAVFSHLLTFFSRYYETGDFISQRRYKGNTYAIPYAGEEVMLHWANKDQYYTKSGESFSNYSFKLGDGRTVNCRLIAADTAKDNRKDNDKERRFALIDHMTATRIDDDGEEWREILVPVEEVNGELTLRFTYKAMPKGTKQDALTTKAVATILDSDCVKNNWLDLTKREPTEKNPQRTLLEKHLTNYTQKNSADYFIHKNLGEFLRGELDFYIKNEVMNLDDVQNAQAFANIEKSLRMIQCLRAIASDLIVFLAQLEDFQKKLWLKKKFVVSAHYCMTLDRVPEDLYPAIVANEKQWQQWHGLGLRDTPQMGSVEDLKEQLFLMVDTSLYTQDFKSKLISKVADLDKSVDGLLVHGDNFQALSLLEDRYRGAAKCIYIDPPYNTSSSAILYKNDFKHSAWASMIIDRARKLYTLLPENGAMFVSIDKHERTTLEHALDEVFGADNHVEELIWSMNTNNSQAPNYSTNHEYVLVYSKNRKVSEQDKSMFREPKPGYSEVMTLVAELAPKYCSIPEIEEEISALYGRHRLEYREQIESLGLDWDDEKSNDPWKGLFNYNKAEYRTAKGKLVAENDAKAANASIWIWREDNISMPATKQATSTNEEGHKNWRWYRPLHPVTGKPCPHPKSGWKFAYEDDLESPDKKSFKSLDSDGRIVWGQDEKKIPQLKRILHEVESNVGKSVFADYSDGEKQTFNLFGRSGIFLAPKHANFVARFIQHASKKNSLIVDCFGGSGSTAHAVVELNRLDHGNRKYVLVEQGEYFETVIKPRMIKVAYSAEWRSGKPVSNITGTSHAFKVLKIEGYEDTLNNLQLSRSSNQSDLLSTMPDNAKEDYLLKYMLDVESRGSLLSVESFKKPFDFKLKVAVDSAGASEVRTVDLVETFNYLIGLTVKTIDADMERGFVTVVGRLPSGERTLVLWRDCEKIGYEELTKFCDKLAVNPSDTEYDVVYVNGDHNIPSVLTSTEDEGGITRTLKLRQIEPEFLSAMFDVDDV